jgi:hypothetical protein
LKKLKAIAKQDLWVAPISDEITKKEEIPVIAEDILRFDLFRNVHELVIVFSISDDSHASKH